MGFTAEQLKAKRDARQAANSQVQGASIFTEGAAPVEEKVETAVEPLIEVTEDEKEVLLAEEESVATEVEPAVGESTLVIEEVEEVPATVVQEEVVIEESAQAEEPPLTIQPTLADSSAFQKLTASSETTGLNGSDSYAELVESMVSQQCQMSGVKNLDLTTFGLRAQVLNFPNLSVMKYGVHKFLGAPFTEEEENLIIHRLGLHVAQSGKSRIVVRAVQEVKDGRGMSFYSLLFNDDIAQRFANMFNYTVHANINEADVSKLVLVIQK